MNTNSRRHVENVGTVVTMITTDIEGGLGRSSSMIAMVHFLGQKMKLPGIGTHKTKKVEKQLGETRKLD